MDAGPAVEVGFFHPFAVHEELAFAELDAIAREGDDALYLGVFTAVGALEEDDIAALGFLEVVGELVDQDAVPNLER